MPTQSASLSDLGRRKNNEDFAAYFEPTDPAELQQSGSLYIVADGVGGAAKGERASQFAAQKLLYEYYQAENADLDPPERMRLIMEHANDNIYTYASENHTRMATTIVAAVIRSGYLYVANVGDSRVYLLREGIVTQINRDHSIVGELTEQGEMTETEAMASKIKNRLTRSLGGDPEVAVSVYSPLQLQNEDRILLCSDGLTRYASRDDVAKMTAQGTNEEIAQRLVQFSNKSGGADNITVLVVSYVDQSVLQPTVRIARPKQVDLDTLITDPGVKIKSLNRNRKSKVAITWLISLGIISLLILGGVAGKLIVKILYPEPTSTDALLVETTSITQTPTILTPTPNMPTLTPIIPTLTPTVLLKPDAINNCNSPIAIRTAPGMKALLLTGDNGAFLIVAIDETVMLTGKQTLLDPNEHTGPNPTGLWLLINPRGWISKEACLSVSPDVINALPEIK